MNYLGKVHPVFYCVLSFAIGVVFALLEMTDLIFLIIVMGFSSLILYYLRKTPKIFLYGAFLLIGFVRSDMWIEEFGSAQRDAVDFQFLGYISAEPDVREFNTRLVVSINNSHERVLITLPHYPEYSYGDYMYVSGELELPSVFETDSGRMFHYDTFLKKDKIYYTMKYPEINLLSSGTHGNKLTKALLDFKRVLISQIELSLPEPHSSLLAGLLVGAKSSMGDELLDDFRKTGVIHIVVLSGFNVTIIAEAIMRMLAFLGVVGSGIFGSVAILFFTIMTGASATVVRASLMAFLVILARLTGYQSHIVRSLFVAGFCMVLHNPMILLYDPSFQLSFLATLGLIVIVPWIETKLSFIPKTRFDFRGLAAASLGTQLFVLPMLVWMSGEVSLVSPVVNILVLWVVPITMLFGFIMICVSVFSTTLVVPLTGISWVLLGYVLTIVGWFGEVPFASIETPELSLFGLLLIYMLYMVVWWYRKNRQAEPAG